jgi:hypothetical protein
MRCQQRCLAVQDGEYHAVCVGVDVPVSEVAIGVLIDAEQAEEGQRAGAPVASALEGGVVDVAMKGDEVGYCDGLFGLGHLIGVEVVDTAQDAPERLTAWERAMAE